MTNDRRMSGVCCRTETHKLVLWTADGECGGELYDLANDPEELVNRFGDPALAAARRELTDWIIERWLEVDSPPSKEEWEGERT